MTDEIAVYEISEVRTYTVADDSDSVVIAITTGQDVQHFRLSRASFKGLAQQMSRDAQLICD